MHSFVVYIDESGDDGIGKFKSGTTGGASHWLTLGCVIVTASNDLRIPSWRDEIINEFGWTKKRDLHFETLSHDQRVVASRIVGRKPLRIAAVMSNKPTIVTHPRPDLFAKKNTLYWYLCRYLIERIARFCAMKAPALTEGNGQAKIIFSRRGGLEYTDFQNYLRHLKKKQEDGDKSISIDWPVIDIDSVTALNHGSRAGLQIADVAVSGLTKAVELNNYGDCEQRYASFLRRPVIMNKWGRRLYEGLKPVPKLEKIALTTEQRDFFLSFAER